MPAVVLKNLFHHSKANENSQKKDDQYSLEKNKGMRVGSLVAK